MKSIILLFKDKEKIGKAEASGIVNAVFFGATFAEVNAHDLARHRSWVLGDVDGGFSFLTKVAAHLFFSVCGVQ